MTPYEILGVSPGEKNLKVIKRAYHRLLRVHKPEKDPQGFQRIRNAYDALKDMLETIAAEKEEQNSYLAREMPPIETDEQPQKAPNGHCQLDMDTLDAILREWSQKNKKETLELNLEKLETHKELIEPESDFIEPEHFDHSQQYCATKIPPELEWYIKKLKKPVEKSKEAWVVEIAREFTQKIKSYSHLTTLWSDVLLDTFEDSLLDTVVDDNDLWWELENGQYKLTEIMIDNWWDYDNYHRLVRFGRAWVKKIDNHSYPYTINISIQLVHYLTLTDRDTTTKLADKIFALDPKNAHIHLHDQIDDFLMLARDISKWPIASRHYISQVFFKETWDPKDKREIAHKTYPLIAQLPSNSHFWRFLKDNFPHLATYADLSQGQKRKEIKEKQALSDKQQGRIIVFVTLFIAICLSLCSRAIEHANSSQKTYVSRPIKVPKINVEEILQKNKKIHNDAIKQSYEYYKVLKKHKFHSELPNHQTYSEYKKYLKSLQKGYKLYNKSSSYPKFNTSQNNFYNNSSNRPKSLQNK